MRFDGRARGRAAVVVALISIVSVPTALQGDRVAAAQAVSVSIISQSTWIDGSGFAHCVGEVQNTGGANANFVQVSLNEYNASNTLLATDFTYALVFRS